MRPLSCISFESYIKPQLGLEKDRQRTVVYLLNPTSNHNCACCLLISEIVVYLLNPTSNHNALPYSSYLCMLYIFWLLHQTTTSTFGKYFLVSCISFDSYIKPQHVLRMLPRHYRCISFDSYIKPQLSSCMRFKAVGCISFDSYIKPQLLGCKNYRVSVVYLLTPTSNHNIILDIAVSGTVVYLLTPTSNHNCWNTSICKAYVVYLLTPTSNHNHDVTSNVLWFVVYLLTPTSNHNLSESMEYMIIALKQYHL